MKIDLFEQVRIAILAERKRKRGPRVTVGKPYLLYHVKKDIPVYCSNITCLEHVTPCHWVDAAYLFEDQIYVVLLEDFINTGFILGEYIQLCVLRKKYQEGKY